MQGAASLEASLEPEFCKVLQLHNSQCSRGAMSYACYQVAASARLAMKESGMFQVAAIEQLTMKEGCEDSGMLSGGFSSGSAASSSSLI